MTELRENLLLAISEHHSGNAEEGEKISDAALSAFKDWLEGEAVLIAESPMMLAALNREDPMKAAVSVCAALASQLKDKTNEG